MALRRVAFLIIGFAGSVLAVAMLYISAAGFSIVQNTPSMPVDEPRTYEEVKVVSLPAPVPGTTLLIEKICSYDGPYLEDGSDMEVVNIAAVYICNAGSKWLSKASITLQYDETVYTFSGKCIPPGGTVVLLEQSAKPYRQDYFSSCCGWQETAKQEPIQGITVTDRAMGTLIVFNTTENTLYDVNIHYKTWLSPPDVYMGGITYTVQIPFLQPGQSATVYPHHYASGYSKVVCVMAQSD